MSNGVAGVDGPEVTYNDVDTFDVEAPTVVCGIWGGELDAAVAPVVISCDVEGNRGGFLLCFSRWLVTSLCSLGSLCFLGSLRTSFTSDFLDSLPSRSRCSCKDKTKVYLVSSTPGNSCVASWFSLHQDIMFSCSNHAAKEQLLEVK